MLNSDKNWWTGQEKKLEGDFLGNLILKEGSAEELRIQRIRSRLLAEQRPRISVSRAKLFTAAYQKYQSDPPCIRKAKCFLHIARHIPIPLIEEQLLMGSPVSCYNAIEVYPEYYTGYLLSKVPGKEITELRYLPEREVMPVDILYDDLVLLEEEILPCWKDKCLSAYIRKDLNEFYPQTGAFINDARVFLTNFGKGFSHTIQDYRSVLQKGLKGIKAEIEEKKEWLSRNIETEADISKLHLFQSMLISADAVIEYARRCAQICASAADSAENERREELLALSQICSKVPEHPASSWWEALQSIYFVYAFTFLAEGGVSHSLGRMDYYLYPFYKKWAGDKTGPKEKAQELLECFFLKCYEYQSLRDARAARGLSGDRTNDKITLGGIDAEGNDTANELSYRFLEAHAHVHLKEPNLSLRLHKNSPRAFLFSALEVVRLGSGLPQFINDEVIIPALISRCKVRLEDARNYADVGCQENYLDPNSSPAQADTNGHSNAGFFNFVKVLELALHAGMNPVNSRQAGPKTKNPDSCETMESFVSLFREQLNYAIKMNVRMNHLVEYHFANTFSNPWHSLMHPGPRKSGRDYAADGCRYNWTGAVGVGLATAADSLMVIEELIYNRQGCAWSEMLSALEANWQGYAELRSSSLALPRYGACGKRAEFWSKWIVDAFCEEYAKYTVLRSKEKNSFVTGLFSMGIHLVLGEDVRATPDGRFAGEMLSGSIAPSQYARARGYTATHNAAAGIGSAGVPNGIVFNQVMPFEIVSGPRYLKKWSDLLRTYFELGGMSVQYSIVDRDRLKSAQRDPQQHKDIIVRVGGYSARFVDLARRIQDDFIKMAVY
jgi:formate C-acetyltransferase